MRSSRLAVIALFLSLALALSSCGGSDKALTVNTQSSAVNGNWTASAASSVSGTQPITVTFMMTSSGVGGMMNFSGIQIPMQNACFGSGTTVIAIMTMGGMMMGSSPTTMSMDMWSAAAQTGNHLHVVVTMSSDMHSGSGQYTLTGVISGCLSDSGTFTMTHQ